MCVWELDGCMAMGPERLYSANELAKLAGVGPTTIHNWTRRPSRALATVAAPSGRLMYRLADLRQFIAENPDLRAAVTAGVRLDQADLHQSTTADAPNSDETAEALRAALRDLKTALDASTRAVARYAELEKQTAAARAEIDKQTATAHSEIVADLQVALRAYDSAFTIATASVTRHD